MVYESNGNGTGTRWPMLMIMYCIYLEKLIITVMFILSVYIIHYIIFMCDIVSWGEGQRKKIKLT